VLSPDGDSGQQWDAWSSVFGRVDRAANRVRPMFDAQTGLIDREVVEREWSRYDIARRLDREWQTKGPIFIDRVRLLCGTRDNFYLNRAVERLKALVERRRAALGKRADDGNDGGATPPPALGYIELVPGATHGSLPSLAALRWNGEMKAHLKRHGLN